MSRRTAGDHRGELDVATVEPEPAAVDPVAEATPMSPISGLLGLQQAGGNRAVSQLIARQHAGTMDAGTGTDASAGGGGGTAAAPAVSTADSAYNEAVAHADWDAAARALVAMDAGARRTRLDAADTPRLVHLAQAAERIGNEQLTGELTTKLAEPGRAAAAAQVLREDAWNAAFSTSNWPGLVRALEMFDDVGMDAKLATLHLEQLNATSDAAKALRPAMERAWIAVERNRIRKLGEMYSAAWHGGQWEQAVILVQAYNDIDLPLKLNELDQPGIDALCRQADRMPSYVRVRTAAEPIRIRKLGEAYEAAVNAGTWPQAVVLLNAYNDDDLLPKARLIKAKGAAAMTAAAAAATAQWSGDDNNRVRRTLSFIQVEDQVGPSARPASSGTGYNLGAATDAGVAVPGGTVTTHTGVQVPGGAAADSYSFNYQGADAQNTGWVQFISREMERFDAATGGNSLGFVTPATLTHLGQPETIRYGTPAAPDWHVDTFSDNMPFYEATTSSSPPAGFLPAGSGATRVVQPSTPASGGAAALPGQTAMVDRPGSVPSHVDSAFAPVPAGLVGTTAVRRVESRCRFTTYLVRGMSVLYKNTMLVTDTYTTAPASGGAAVRSNTAGAGGACAAFEPPHYQALIRRFPRFTYFPH
jgi:hypothetical protein